MTEEEYKQIYQTIEMFEAITQSQPDDYQSLEILKEAYLRIGRDEDAMRVSRQLVDAYLANGQNSSAMLECEGILQREPNSPEVIAVLGELEARLNAGGSGVLMPGEIGGGNGSGKDARSVEEPDDDLELLPAESDGAPGDVASAQRIQIDYEHEDRTPDRKLIETAETRRAEIASRMQGFDLEGDGNEELAQFLVHWDLVPREVVSSSLEVVRSRIVGAPGRAPGRSLLEEIGRSGIVPIETLLSDLMDRTRLPYVPLQQYDIDRQIGAMLPEELALRRLIVAFDVMSRTLLVAFCNPLDRAGKEAVERSVDYHVQWHLAMPSAIDHCLREIYHLGPATGG